EKVRCDDVGWQAVRKSENLDELAVNAPFHSFCEVPKSPQSSEGKTMLEKYLSAAFFGAMLAVATMADCVQVQAQQVLRVGFQDAEPGLVRNSTNQLGG